MQLTTDIEIILKNMSAALKAWTEYWKHLSYQGQFLVSRLIVASLESWENIETVLRICVNFRGTITTIQDNIGDNMTYQDHLKGTNFDRVLDASLLQCFFCFNFNVIIIVTYIP